MFAEIFPRIIVKDCTKGEIEIKQDELFQAFNDDSDSWNVKLVEELFALAQKADKSFCSQREHFRLMTVLNMLRMRWATVMTVTNFIGHKKNRTRS